MMSMTYGIGKTEGVSRKGVENLAWPAVSRLQMSECFG